MVSFRLGGSDGVSIEAAKWAWALGELGFEVRSVAGDGPVDQLLPGLAIDAAARPGASELHRALDGCDLVVVENLCSLPLNPAAAEVVWKVLAGRPAVFHHHDLPWQRTHLAHLPPPADDPAWRHVTINELSRRQLDHHGIAAVTMYNSFDPDPAPGRRLATRDALGVGPEPLVLQPTRAIPRKNVGVAVALAEALGAVYWLLGPAEDGYGPELERILAAARCPVVRGPAQLPDGGPMDIADAYAACDLVALPSSWEGFGNPAIESATYHQPLAIGPYPVGTELAAFGFEWFAADDPWPLTTWMESPDPGLLMRNAAVAREHFNLSDLPARLSSVVESAIG